VIAGHALCKFARTHAARGLQVGAQGGGMVEVKLGISDVSLKMSPDVLQLICTVRAPILCMCARV